MEPINRLFFRQRIEELKHFEYKLKKALKVKNNPVTKRALEEAIEAIDLAKFYINSILTIDSFD